MRFTIITYIDHSRKNHSYFSYAPYIREMDLWLKQVEEVELVAPLSHKEFPDAKPYEHTRIIFTEIPSFNLLSLTNGFRSVFKIPIVCLRILRAMRRSDHIHLRCPGNISLIACILQIFFPRKMKSAKYAGNWAPRAKQPWSYRLQKWILSNPFLTKNMTVLTYGEWPGQSNNIRSFFTASFPGKAILKVQEKRFNAPYLFVFVGNLVSGKGLKTALILIRKLQDKEVGCMMEIYGDGPEREPAEAYVKEVGIKGVTFKGNRRLEELETVYQRAHFLILPSKSEGWPKAVAEAMFFGCIPMVTPVSCVPWMLGKEGDGTKQEERGILLVDRGQRVEGQDIEENVQWILKVLGDEERMSRMSEAAKRWSQQYTLERLEAGISKVLSKNYK